MQQELVEFYYLWKKTPGANNNRPHRRRRQSSLRRIRNTRNSRAGTPKEEVPTPTKDITPTANVNTKEPASEAESVPVGTPASHNPGGEVSSVTEDDNSEEDSDSRDTNTNGTAHSCQHCFSTSSKDYQVAGKDRLLLCTECRVHLKKSGELPPAPPYLFRPVPAESPESPGRMRTRNKAKETPRPARPRRTGGTDTPDQEKQQQQQSPDKSKKKSSVKVETPKKGAQKRSQADDADDDKEAQKRKRVGAGGGERAESPSESLTTDSNSLMDEPERETEADANENQSTPPTVAGVVTEEPVSPAVTTPEEPSEPTPVSTPVPAAIQNLPISVPVIHSLEKKPPLLESESLDQSKVVDHQTEDAVTPLVMNQPLNLEPLVPIESVVPSPTSNDESKEAEQPGQLNLSVSQSLVVGQSTNDVATSAVRNLSQALPPACVGIASGSQSMPISSQGIPLISSAQQQSVVGGLPTSLSMQYAASSLQPQPPPPPPPPVQNVPQNLSQSMQLAPSIASSMAPNAPPNMGPSLRVHADSLPSAAQVLPPPQGMSGPPLNLNISQSQIPAGMGPIGQLSQIPPPMPSSPQPLGLTVMSSENRNNERMAPDDRLSNERARDSRMPERMVVSERHSERAENNEPERPSEPSNLFQPIQSSGMLPMEKSTGIYNLAGTPPMEPQNLKIKQEIIPPEPDPLQSLKEVKVPGFQSSAFPGPSLDNIKKDPDGASKPPTPSKHSIPINQSIPSMQPVAASPTPTPTPTPSLPPPPNSIPQPVMHPAQQPSSHMAHPFHAHPLIHHSLFASVHPYHHAYPPYGAPVGGYPPFPPYAYGPVPHAIPPPSPQRSQESNTMITAHHASTSSSVTSREEGENLIATHHHSSSMHQATTLHHDKLLTISSHSSHSHSSSHGSSQRKPSLVSATCLTSTSSAHHHHRPPQPQQPPIVAEPKIDQDMEQEPEEAISPRGTTPEARIEDSECHRSHSAIFLRHWNRGENNSCTRTDMVFKPVPNSKLARKRDERSRKQAEREREEQDRAAAAAQQARKMTTPEKQPEVCKPPSRGPLEPVVSPYDRYAARPGSYADTPALRQLSEYARPHAAFSPARHPAPPDPMLHYIYGRDAATAQRLEMEHMEREKREREMRELRERELSERIKEELYKGTTRSLPAPVDTHWLEMHRRYAAGLAPGPSGPPQALHQFGLYGAPPGPSQLERERLERLGNCSYGVLDVWSNRGRNIVETLVGLSNHAYDISRFFLFFRFTYRFEFKTEV